MPFRTLHFTITGRCDDKIANYAHIHMPMRIPCNDDAMLPCRMVFLLYWDQVGRATLGINDSAFLSVLFIPHK